MRLISFISAFELLNQKTAECLVVLLRCCGKQVEVCLCEQKAVRDYSHIKICSCRHRYLIIICCVFIPKWEQDGWFSLGPIERAARRGTQRSWRMCGESPRRNRMCNKRVSTISSSDVRCNVTTICMRNIRGDVRIPQA